MNDYLNILKSPEPPLLPGPLPRLPPSPCFCRSFCPAGIRGCILARPLSCGFLLQTICIWFGLFIGLGGILHNPRQYGRLAGGDIDMQSGK